MELPSGTVTLLFTDIESSMVLWSTDADSMAASLAMHDRVMTEQIEAGGGYVFTRAGDSFSAAFPSAREAVAVAQQCQRRLRTASWPGPELKVRMGVHLGDVQLRDGDYFGPTVNVAARISDCGHGGQIVASTDVVDAAGLIGPTTPLGSYLLRGVSERIELHQVGAGDFPALRAEQAGAELLRFDQFEIDLGARIIRDNGEPVHVEPQVLDVLVYLMTHRDRLVSQEELLDEVWGDQFVSLSALTTRIKQARQALGDDGRTQRYVRNERGRGYQFMGEVAEERPATAAPPTSSSCSASSAPVRRSVTIFGRSADLSAVDELVASSSLTTVVGPGGVGKTTLITAFISDWATSGRSATLVRLDAVRDSSGLHPAITTALGLSGDDGVDPVAAAAEWLSATGQVLVLDNCEHLLNDVRDLVRTLLDVAPTVQVLATSRQPLGLGAESIYRLQPLGVPDDVIGSEVDSWPVLELFQAAARRSGGLHIDGDDEWTAVIELCRRLDGLPLAVELAASRLSTLGIRDLVGALDDRLDWFRNRDVDAGDRQRSLRSTVEWSFRFLDDDCLKVVAGLSQFPAGLRLPELTALARGLGTQESAEEVVARLVDASVLTKVVSGGVARYSMLETIRQYGIDTLLSDPELRDAARAELRRHALDISQSERDYWTGDLDPRGRSLAQLRDELPNLRAARDLMVADGDGPSAVRLALGLCAFTEEANLGELWSWHDVERLPGLDDADAETQSAVDLLRATLARNQGQIELCGQAAAAASANSTDRWIVGRALHTEAMASLFSGDPLRAAELWLRSDEQLGGVRGRLFAAMASAFAGDLDLAASYLASAEITEDSRVPADLHTNVHLVRGEVARIADTGDARQEFEQAVEVARQHGLMFSLGIAQVPLVALLEAEGDTAGAAGGYEELLQLFLRAGTWTQVWTTLRNAARLLAEASPASALLICAASVRDPRAPALDEDGQRELDALHAAATERLGADEVARVERRASLVPRADVARDAVEALRNLR